MFKKECFDLRKSITGLSSFVLVAILATVEVFAQGSAGPVSLQSDGSNWPMIILFLLVGCLAVAIYIRFKSKNEAEAPASPYKRVSYEDGKSGGVTREERKLEWLKKNGKLDANSDSASTNGHSSNGHSSVSTEFETVDQSSAELPIYSFEKLKTTEPFIPLVKSDDEALISAIEQVREEFEEDEEIRTLAVRVLAAFKTSNSIDALSQVALYDLSSNQRSFAVTTLSEFDHESVFETILLACADPTREVRAAAARALFHLTFDRAEAWARIANLQQKGRMIQMARAAIEADLVERSFERLIHRDRKYAYEAFALVTLLIRAGETDVVIDFLKRTKDAKLRQAILNTIKVSKNKHGLEALNSLLNSKTLSPEMQEDIDKTIEEMGFVTV